MADNETIIVAFACFGVGVLTGVSLAFVFVWMSKMAESTQQTRELEVETDEAGVIKRVVTA